MTHKDKAQEALDACVSHNGYHGMPPWMTGLKIAVIAVGVLEAILGELQTINENGKLPLRKR